MTGTGKELAGLCPSPEWEVPESKELKACSVYMLMSDVRSYRMENRGQARVGQLPKDLGLCQRTDKFNNLHTVSFFTKSRGYQFLFMPKIWCYADAKETPCSGFGDIRPCPLDRLRVEA